MIRSTFHCRDNSCKMIRKKHNRPFGANICTKIVRKTDAKTHQTSAKTVKRAQTTILGRSLDNMPKESKRAETKRANSGSFPSTEQKNIETSKNQGRAEVSRIRYTPHHKIYTRKSLIKRATTKHIPRNTRGEQKPP